MNLFLCTQTVSNNDNDATPLCLELRFYLAGVLDREHRRDSVMGHAVRSRSASGKVHVENDGLRLSERAQQTAGNEKRRIRAGEFSAGWHRDLAEQTVRYDTAMARR